MKIFTWLFTVAVASIVAGAERDGEARKELAGVWEGRVDEGATAVLASFGAAFTDGRGAERRIEGPLAGSTSWNAGLLRVVRPQPPTPQRGDFSIN